MASIVITINTDGTAFHDYRSIGQDRLAKGQEIARILRLLAGGVVHCADPSVLALPRDKNDNPCGTVEVIE